MNDQNGKQVAPQAERVPSNTEYAMDLTEKSRLNHLQNMLKDLKITKNRELDDMKRELAMLEDKINKIDRQVFVIDAKEQAVRAAIRSLEDVGL